MRRANGESFAGTAKDISIGGMFVVSAQRLEFGEQLSIALSLPDLQQELTLPATVRWTIQTGFGVQFGLIGARETHALSEFIADYRSRHP